MQARRLLEAELRKCVDTIASRWVIAAMIVLSCAALTINKIADVDDFGTFVRGATLPLPALLPILAVLATTGDWTQRSAMTTFVLVPQRSLVLGTRLVAAVIMVLGVTAAISVISLATFLVLFPGGASSVLTVQTASSLLSMTGLSTAAALTGTAAGFLLLSTPLAITTTLLLPFVYDVGIGLALPHVAPWVSILAFSAWMTQPEWAWTTTHGTEVGIGPALTSFLLFVIAPIVLGWWRQLRREVK
ncbi:hypothetical protein EDF46_2833 [Frondihabitans sp. PhB188]|uniref:hypothetical protein n=1 Tax=Frondihabitans sp. PhB188 TaxID=2485200 RepID=UPI000FBC5C78|nr:hypothetical protein [Frondihabitans sp. PhB188]ROQ37377.1 hypothetical protein EDF46_2833 [Frondihabitans sp. PhB188]